MNATRSRASTVRKIVGSLGVLGTAAAVAGLGTFGAFTDSTTPISTEVASGTVAIDLAAAGVPFPAVTDGFVPGDSVTRAFTLINSGTTALGSVTLGVTAAAPSVLTTDTVHGLQLQVRSCPEPWAAVDSSPAPAIACSGAVTTLASGAVLGDHGLGDLASLQPGGTDHLALSLSLPTSADNTFQGQTSTLRLAFTGIQRAGAAR